MGNRGKMETAGIMLRNGCCCHVPPSPPLTSPKVMFSAPLSPLSADFSNSCSVLDHLSPCTPCHFTFLLDYVRIFQRKTKLLKSRKLFLFLKELEGAVGRQRAFFSNLNNFLKKSHSWSVLWTSGKEKQIQLFLSLSRNLPSKTQNIDTGLQQKTHRQLHKHLK